MPEELRRVTEKKSPLPSAAGAVSASPEPSAPPGTARVHTAVSSKCSVDRWIMEWIEAGLWSGKSRDGCHGCGPRPLLAEKATSPCKLVFIFLVGLVQVIAGRGVTQLSVARSRGDR